MEYSLVLNFEVRMKSYERIKKRYEELIRKSFKFSSDMDEARMRAICEEFDKLYEEIRMLKR